MIKKVAFTAYKANDLKRAINFYENILGLKQSANFNDAWVEYDLPGGGCFAITSMGGDDWQPSANFGGSIAFEVDNIQSFMEKLKENDVRIKMDIFESPVCHMAVILDSEDNALMIHEVKNKK